MLKEPLQLHCIGGLVICYFYGLPRVTGDIDYYAAVPANLNLLDIAGKDLNYPTDTKSGCITSPS